MQKDRHILSQNALKFLAVLIICGLSSLALSQQPTNLKAYFTRTKHLSASQSIPLASQLFLGQPYQLNPTGDSEQAQFDQRPSWRLDAFDCMTYVETVLALSLVESLENLDGQVRLIRYYEQPPSFLHRNHFASLDWNPHQHRLKILRDITTDFKNDHGESLAKTAISMINKPDWFAHLTPARLQPNQKMSRRRRKDQLKLLQQQGKATHSQLVKLPYLPLQALFDHQGQPIKVRFARIPSGSIIEIVHPNWDLRKQIGTHLLVSHMGFAIRTPQGLMFRHASSKHGAIVDTPLADYLQQYLNKPTSVGGIHLEAVTA